MAEPRRTRRPRQEEARQDREAVSLLFDKIPPQDLDAERSVLGSMLLSDSAIDDAIMHVSADRFYHDANRKVFKVVHDMYESGLRAIDVVTVGAELQKRGELEEIGGLSYLNTLMETVPVAAHAEYYAKIVKDKWLQRSLIDACNESLRDAFNSKDDIGEVLSQAERRIFDIVERQATTDKFAIGDILEATFERIFHRMDQEGTLSGLHTGFHGLDDVTSGFQPSELIVLAARPSMGKTALVCNFSLAVAHQRQGCLLFSLEQSKLELAERLLCIQAKINGHKLRQGSLDEIEQAALMEGANELRDLPLYIDDVAGRTVSQISAIARRLKRRFGLGIVIIDYLQLIEADEKGLPREQQISTITRRLKFLAKDLSVPVIALAQLNRGVEQREDKRPKLSDLRESGAIEQDADIVMFLHRPDAYDPGDRPGEADLIVAKNRSGPIGTVGLVWMREQLRFGDKAAVDVPAGMGDF